MQIAFTTLGCKVNQFDTAMMESLVEGRSHELVPFNERADVYVINTCTVTQKSDYQSRQLIRRAIRQNPRAKIIVTGCYAETHPEEVRQIPGVHLVLGNAQKIRLLEQLEDCGQSISSRILVDGFEKREVLQQPLLNGGRERTRIFLKIQDGCNFRCSFCIIPKARGPSRSLPVAQVIEQIHHLVQSGYQEVVLTGVYLGAYGQDLTPLYSLSKLLMEIAGKTSLPRLRLSSIDPRDFDKELLEALGSLANLCQHLHIPLQSGDDQVLHRMRRGYTSAFYRQLVLELKERLPDLWLGTDVMVGFPGEGETQFQRTFQLLEALPVTSLHVFPYSTRPGTPASTMRGQISAFLKQKRGERLRKLSQEKEEVFKRRFLGRLMPILIQEEVGGRLQGISHNYLKVQIPKEKGLENFKNRLVPVQIDRLEDGKLIGHPEKQSSTKV